MTRLGKEAVNRRSFIQSSIASLMITGCGTAKPQMMDKLPSPTAEQKSMRRQSPSMVAIARAESYYDDLFLIIKPYLRQLNIEDIKDKSVVLKPNMIECPPGKPTTTHPSVVKAAIQVADYLGAGKITVAEGPGHMRDTEFLLEATGIGKACKEMAVPFVDLNLDDLIEVPNSNSFCHLDQFYLPKTIVNADAVISLPKMKTHHWVGVTASMKNLFGIVPGRKYGYPKNLLHYQGIPQCILDLNRLIRTSLSIVDAVVAMEGDGPVNGTARDMGLIVMGTDPAAVDASCAKIMGFDISELDYINVAGQVIGNVKPEEIHILGCPVGEVAVEFQRPITYGFDKKLFEKAWHDQSQFAVS